MSALQALDNLPGALTPAALRQIYRLMCTARAIDERAWLLNRQGILPFVVSCQGHEAAQAGSILALRRELDWVSPYYRDIAVILGAGMTVREVMLSIFAKAEDPCSGGRQMPGHYGHHKLRMVSASSPIATQCLHMAGVALAAKIKKESSVSFCYFGEGATSAGDFHEALNFASIHALPVVFICENNGWAISVPQRLQMNVQSVADRACAYGMPGVAVDGLDPEATYYATAEAVERARTGGGPTLIEARCQRLTPHSSDDDDRAYRGSARAMELAVDPVAEFRNRLMKRELLTPAEDRSLQEIIAAEVEEATNYALSAADPSPADAMRHVYAEREEPSRAD